MQANPEFPMFASEVRFYREVFAISWEYGSALRKARVLVPDATLATGGMLYELTPQKVQAARAAVFLAKSRLL